jgi:hypothetical protein
MAIAGFVLISSVALYMLEQIEDLRSPSNTGSNSN